MSATGHLIDSHWTTAPGQPDLLFLGDPLNGYRTSDPSGPIWAIEAPGVAREYADSIPAQLCFARRWSPFDEQIIAAVGDACASSATGWPLAASVRVRAGTRLAARFATGPGASGSLTTVDVHTVIDDTYFAAYEDRDVPPFVIDKIAAAVLRSLTRAKIPVTGVHAVSELPAGTRISVADGKTGLVTRPASQDLLERALGGFTRFADRLGTAEERFHQWLRNLWRPVWVVRVPAGRLPVRLCRAVSYLTSHIVIPLGVIGGGFWLTWRLSFPGWRGTWYGSAQTGHAQGAWHPAWWALPLWLAVSYIVGCAARKLVNLELRPAGSCGRCPGRCTNGAECAVSQYLDDPRDWTAGAGS